MSQLAFYPWLAMRADCAAGALRLIRYERGKTPAVQELPQIDRALTPYKTASGRAVLRATLLSFGERGLIDDMTEDDRAHLFAFSELLAFASLSSRRFFGQFGYWNRDHCRLVIQGFSDPEGGALVVTRRRDRVTNSYFSGHVREVQCPDHVHAADVEPDMRLLVALVASRDVEAWPSIEQAVFLFNEANTDRDNVPVTAELLFCYGAIEQILECPGRAPREVATRFAETWVPVAELPRSEWRVPPEDEGARARLGRATSPRAAWLEDLAILRGSTAHGHPAQATPTAWSIHEHLLYAAYAVPLILKLRLAQYGRYELTDDDTGHVEVFERLLNVRHFEPRGLDTPISDHPWHTIQQRGMYRRLAELAFRQVGANGADAFTETQPLGPEEQR